MARANSSSSGFARGGNGTGTTRVSSGSCAPRREHRADQGLRAADDPGRARPPEGAAGRGPQLAGRCRSCRYAAGQRAAGRQRQHGRRELRSHVGGRRRRLRNGPCSGARSAVTGRRAHHGTVPPSRLAHPFGDLEDGERGAFRVLSTRWPASAGTALAGTVSVTGRGHGVPSAGQLAARRDGGQVGGGQVAAERGANAPGGDQLELTGCASPGSSRPTASSAGSCHPSRAPPSSCGPSPGRP